MPYIANISGRNDNFMHTMKCKYKHRYENWGLYSWVRFIFWNVTPCSVAGRFLWNISTYVTNYSLTFKMTVTLANSDNRKPFRACITLLTSISMSAVKWQHQKTAYCIYVHYNDCVNISFQGKVCKFNILICTFYFNSVEQLDMRIYAAKIGLPTVWD
jgi:hypothetical protein